MAHLLGSIQFSPHIAPAQSFETVNVTSGMLDDLIKGMSLAQLVGEIRSPGYPDRLGHYQYAEKGSIFFPCDPRPEEVHIEDIALALSRIPRFNGLSTNYFSVAEHTWIISHMVEGSATKKLAALMHDSAEAYVNDMIRPLKYLPIMGTIYLKIEAGIEKAIGQAFDLPTPFLNDPDIKRADEKLSGREVEINISSTNVNHLSEDLAARAEGGTDEKLHLFYWNSELARLMWLARFHELTLQRAKGL